MDGPELAEALGVTHKNANNLVERLRSTIERSLGALLVCRRVKADHSRCPQLAALVDRWDGQFTVLMRKRAGRHIDGCRDCDDDRSRMVNPVALLGGVPVMVPAPAWLRDQTLTQAAPVLPQTAAAPPGAAAHTATDPSWWPPSDFDTTDLGNPAPPADSGTVPHPPPRRPGGFATESAATKPSAAYAASAPTEETSESTERASGYLRRHSLAVGGIGLVIVGVGAAVLLATPEIYRVDPTNAPGEAMTTTPTTSPPLTVTLGPGGGGPTVPPSTTPTASPPLTVTLGPGGGGPTVPPSTMPLPTPTSNPPPKPKPLGPTGLNPPSQQDPSDNTCPPTTTCPINGPFL
jgi:hypothetical protein